MMRLGEGAEARISVAKVAGSELLVKTRYPKAYRLKELDTRIRRSRTRKEAKIMERAAKAGVSVPGLVAVSEFSIVMERVTGAMLMDTGMGMETARRIGVQLAMMHDAGITHGDFTPANIMISNGTPVIIDFGLGEMTKNSEERALDLLLMKRSIPSAAYRSLCKGYAMSKSSGDTIRRLAEIELRGRYQQRTIA